MKEREKAIRIKIKFSLLKGGGGVWGQRGRSSKDAVFRGKAPKKSREMHR